MKDIFLKILAQLGLQIVGILSIVKIPASLFQVAKVMHPKASGIPNQEFFAFGWIDANFRAWYNKIAADFKIQGRFGYAWDDGLGLALGPRIYNNWATYWLLGKLGARRMAALGYLLASVCLGLVCGSAFGFWVGILAILLAAGSPLYIINYTDLGKPEMFWWGLAGVNLYLGFSGYMLVAGLMWSFIALVSLPVSVMLLLVAGPAILLLGMQSDQLLGVLIGVTPGAVKHTIRIYQMWRSGFMGKLVSEQAGLWKRRWLDITREVFVSAPFVVGILIAGFSSGNIVPAGLLVVMGVLTYYINWRLLYMNDEQSFLMVLFLSAIAFASAAHSLLGLLISALLAYRFSFIPAVTLRAKREKQNGIMSTVNTLLKSVWAFPIFEPVRRPSLGALSSFFSAIPKHGRILAESHGRLREQNGWRSFWEWVKDILLTRHIALVNDMYTGMTEPKLDNRYTSRFNVLENSPTELAEMCTSLGVGHVVAHSPKMVEKLLDVGFNKVAECDLTTLEHYLKHALKLESINRIVLLQHPHQPDVIAPKTNVQFKQNAITLQVREGETYYIRYRYDSGFTARQGDKTLKLLGYRPFEDLPTTFMKVMSEGTLPITLTFRASFY